MNVERWRRRLDRSLGGLLAVLMGAMVLNVLWGVTTRWLLGDPSPYTEEVARYLLIWVGLLGAAYAAGQRRHLAIDLLPQALHGASRRRLALALEVFVALVVAAVLVGGGMLLVRLTLELGQTSAALGVPLGGIYLALPISGALILAYGALHVVEAWAKAPHG